MTTRPATHAGTWYSGSRADLTLQIDGWIDDAHAEKTPGTLRAIIAPHAGYAYSGATAGAAYAAVAAMPADSIDRVVLLGPSHHVFVDSLAVSEAGSCETPLGALAVDGEAVARLRGAERLSMRAWGAEHSLELHMPFLRRALDRSGNGGALLLPVLVGAGGEAEAEALAPFWNARSLFVVSTDFCHWGSRFGFAPYDEDSPLAIHVSAGDVACFDAGLTFTPGCASSHTTRARALTDCPQSRSSRWTGRAWRWSRRTTPPRSSAIWPARATPSAVATPSPCCCGSLRPTRRRCRQRSAPTPRASASPTPPDQACRTPRPPCIT